MQALNTQDAFRQWLSGGDRILENLLNQCSTPEDPDFLVIDCPHLAILREIEMRPEMLAISARRLKKKFIRLCCPGTVPIKIKPEKILKQAMSYAAIHIPSLTLQLPGANPNDAIAIVRMADHKGLHCSADVERHSRAKVNDWVGEDMSKFHIQPELERLTTALYTHGYIEGFQYKALTFQGQEILMSVTAFLGTYNGDLCRVVHVLNSELL